MTLTNAKSKSKDKYVVECGGKVNVISRTVGLSLSIPGEYKIFCIMSDFLSLKVNVFVDSGDECTVRVCKYVFKIHGIVSV